MARGLHPRASQEDSIVARSEIALPIRAATLPDDSVGSAIPELVHVVTSATTDPRLALLVAKFDDDTDEHLFWQVRMPVHYAANQHAGTPRLHVQFYMDEDQVDDSKTVRFEAALLAVTPNADTDEMTALDLTQDGGGWMGTTTTLNHANPADGDHLYEACIDLSEATDSAAAGDLVVVGLRRDTSADTATGDACLVTASLEYTVG